MWGNQILWGDTFVWGDHVVVEGQTHTVLNGDQVVWRGSGLNGQQILWGDVSLLDGVGGLTAWSPFVPDLPFTKNDPY